MKIRGSVYNTAITWGVRASAHDSGGNPVEHAAVGGEVDLQVSALVGLEKRGRHQKG